MADILSSLLKLRMSKRGGLVGLLISLLAILLIILGQSPNAVNQFVAGLESYDPSWHAVTAVHDGDTIDVSIMGKTETIRFIGIDTPETHHPLKPVQCFGQAASQFTAELLSGTDVRLETDPLSSNRDRYGRLLRYVYMRDGRLVNLELIREGYGFAYLSFSFSKSDEFEAAEKTARRNNVGLWENCPLEDSGGYLQTSPITQ